MLMNPKFRYIFYKFAPLLLVLSYINLTQLLHLISKPLFEYQTPSFTSSQLYSLSFNFVCLIFADVNLLHIFERNLYHLHTTHESWKVFNCAEHLRERHETYS